LVDFFFFCFYHPAFSLVSSAVDLHVAGPPLLHLPIAICLPTCPFSFRVPEFFSCCSHPLLFFRPLFFSLVFFCHPVLFCPPFFTPLVLPVCHTSSWIMFASPIHCSHPACHVVFPAHGVCIFPPPPTFFPPFRHSFWSLSTHLCIRFLVKDCNHFCSAIFLHCNPTLLQLTNLPLP